MENQADYLKDITEIRSMMERSSRFISLSGLSGVFAGLFALAGAAAAYFYLNSGSLQSSYEDAIPSQWISYADYFWFIVADAAIVLVASIGTGIFLTTRKAKREGLKVWDSTARRLVINMSIPLVAGGVFCLALFYHSVVGLIAPSMLIFYGLALLNGSKYTFNDIRYLGICEIILGLISLFFIGYGLLFWATGFGWLHIIYGTAMYIKYERKK